MKINTRPISISFVGGSALLLVLLYFHQGIGQITVLLGATFCYAALGLLVGLAWPINAWQVGLVASISPWIFLAWRMYSSQDPENIHLDLSIFIWIPIVALLASYAGTYAARWFVIQRRKRAASGE